MSVESDSPPTVPQSWSDVWMAAITQPSVETYEGLANDTNSEPQSAYKWVFITTLIGVAFSTIVGALFSTALNIGAGGDPALEAALGGGSIFAVLCTGPIGGALAVLLLALWAGVSQLIAGALGGTGSYSKLVYTFAAFAAPLTLVATVLGTFPIIGLLQFPLWLYQLVLSVIAVKAVNQIGWGQAAIASLTLVAVLFVIGICVGLVIGVAALSALSGLS